MAIPKKTRLAVASSKSTPMDYSCQHITTSNFMEFAVSKVIDMVPNQKIQVNHEIFTRLEPMPVPTFGLASIRTNVFFVPYRTVFSAFNDMIGDTMHVFDDGTNFVTSTPYFNYSILSRAFTNTAMCSSAASGYDFQYSDGTNAVNMKFTALGRFAYKLMRTLGYNWTFSTIVDKRVSALPLLAVLRVYYDFYLTSQYASAQSYDNILALFTLNNSRDMQYPIIDTAEKFVQIFQFLYKVFYQSDWINSAWDNPDSPNTGLASSVTINDINGNDTTYDNVVDYNPSTNNRTSPIIKRNSGNGTTSITNISQFMINSLRKLTDYMKRNQIAGSRVIDRYLARFGVELRAEKLNRSYKVASYVQDIQFGDVTSTSDTDGANLGAYAGKGVSFGNGSFEFSTDEYGMLIFVSTIIPKVSYYQGEQRYVNHLTKFDFWTPEFDQLGTQAMASSEVFINPNGKSTEIEAPDYYEQIFGYVPRYSEYKVGYDQITGDYLLPSLNTGKEAWNLFRDLTPFVDSVGLDSVKHSPSFVDGNDSFQYDRIFYNTDDTADKFNVIHNFNIGGSFPGSGLYDTYEFENEDKSAKVTVDVDGTQEQ